MAHKKQSRTEKTGDTTIVYPRTLLDIRDGLTAAMVGSERRLADIKSAFNAVARLHRSDLGAVATDTILRGFVDNPQSILQFFDRRAAMRAGRPRGSWNNQKSRVMIGIRSFHVAHGAPQPPTTLSGSWQILYDTLSTTRERVTFNSFARFCDYRTILPDQVTSELLTDYRLYVENYRLRTRPRAAALAITNLWNRYANHHALWPTIRLEMTRWQNRYALPLDDFSPAFASEVRARQASRLKCELFDEEAHRQIRPVTAASQLQTIRRLATLLVMAEQLDPKQLTSLGQLVTLESVKTIIEQVQQRIAQRIPGTSKTGRLSGDIWLLATIASEQSNCDEKVVERLKMVSRRLRPEKTGMTEKNKGTLNAFDDPQLLKRLLALPHVIRDRVRKRGALRHADAVLLRNAMAVELLFNCPIRMKNLSSIHLTKNLLEAGHKRRVVRLRLEGHEVKNNMEIEFILPDTLVATLDKYRADVLPRFAGPQNEYLFPGRSRGHKRPCALGTQIAQFIERELGVRLTPHQFRHLTAKLYLQQNPGQYEVVRRLLGHTNIQTTIKFYAEMQMTEAGQQWDHVMQELREEAIAAVKASSKRRGRTNEART